MRHSSQSAQILRLRTLNDKFRRFENEEEAEEEDEKEEEQKVQEGGYNEDEVWREKGIKREFKR